MVKRSGIHHPQQCLRKDQNHHLLSSAKPRVASGEGEYSSMQVCVCAATPPAPPSCEPSPYHNKLKTNSKWCCDTVHVWISLLVMILIFFLPGEKRSYTGHLLPYKLDNIPHKTDPQSARRQPEDDMPNCSNLICVFEKEIMQWALCVISHCHSKQPSLVMCSEDL